MSEDTGCRPYNPQIEIAKLTRRLADVENKIAIMQAAKSARRSAFAAEAEDWPEARAWMTDTSIHIAGLAEVLCNIVGGLNESDREHSGLTDLIFSYGALRGQIDALTAVIDRWNT